MQALSDSQHIAAIEAKVDKLEKKIDDGFAKVDQGFAKVDDGFASMAEKIVASERALRSEIGAARSDARADFRTLIAVVFSLWAATVLTVVGVVVAQT
jgi:hypothetical protein